MASVISMLRIRSSSLLAKSSLVRICSIQNRSISNSGMLLESLEKPKWGFPFSEFEKNGGVAKGPPTKGRRFRRMKKRRNQKESNDKRRIEETRYATQVRLEKNMALRKQLKKLNSAYRQAVEEVNAAEKVETSKIL